jgi:hypothetical protein
MLDRLNAPFLERHFTCPPGGRIKAAHLEAVHFEGDPVHVPASVQVRLCDPDKFLPFLQPKVHTLPSVNPLH